ncbi:unnamed protein product [Rotaria socialis]|uniref:Uncharacterized protein n=1 Tax=Rotaria socialis TaxID=392032 RepID=A0A818EH49_9BILA|nr:unnamed protein product [Rotaria socialis]CAF3452271.1 unnamed protein product [Rotaria socialis]CAF3458950.1 unnamed protein product [Rotaria socialis]CAF4129629.1 unnamed protein product [Rotaria socialis]CAF4250515.1 unnamed protein product [Rotaria socialis]
MDFQEQSKTQTTTCFNCQNENSNVRNCLCANCKHNNRLEEKENERMLVVSDINSNDEYLYSSSSSVNDLELISLDTKTLWQDIAHIIKCIYRETNKEFTENHSYHDICKAKQSLQILTQSDAESLFNKMEVIVLEYVHEIRNHVLKRSQTCLKTSNDVQLFISYILDEYNTFIQAAKNVSTIISYLEEQYMQSFHLTWLLYNKHLYEKLVYMDKKIQLSMSTMIDLLQPANDVDNDCSPAEYTQLLNRFLAFDEEMSEIDCLYKDCQMKMNSISKSSLIKKRNQMGIIVTTNKKKICKKAQTIENIPRKNKEILNRSTTNVLNSPSSNDIPMTQGTFQQDSNRSTIDTDDKDDEYMLPNDRLSSSYTAEKLDISIPNNNTINLGEESCHGMLNNDLPRPSEESTLNENLTATITNEKSQKDTEQTFNETSTKKSKSNRCSLNHRKENSTTISNISSSSLSEISLPSNLILPPKPRSSTTSKLAADFRPLTIPLLDKAEIPKCPSLLSAKIQSVSFTAGTFGSITANESTHSSSHNQKCLSINLSRKPGTGSKRDSIHASNKFDSMLHQTTSNNKISALLSSLDSSKTIDDLEKSSFNEQDYDYCCCDLFSESDSSATNGCVACMPLSTNTTVMYNYNQRDAEMKERLKLKLTKRTVENNPDQSETSAANKSKSKQCDNDIDDLLRFIHGNETVPDKRTSKKIRKKKNKRTIINPIPEDINDKEEDIFKSENTTNDTVHNLSKRKQKAKLKAEKEQQKHEDESLTAKPITISIEVAPSKNLDSIKTNIDPISSSSIPLEQEEEVNWITISRKQNKHKTSSTPVSSSPAASVVPSNTIQQKQRIMSTKTKITSTSILTQAKVLPSTVKSNNKPQKSITLDSPSAPSLVKNNNSQKQHKKLETSSAWTTEEQLQVKPSSTLLATAPAFVPSSSLLFPSKVDNTLVPYEPLPMSYSDATNYPLSSNFVQRSRPLFSPAPGPTNAKISRCIQRPSTETCNNSVLLHSLITEHVDNFNSTWTDSPVVNSTESKWNYSDREKLQISTTSNNFPLYDPFNSGAKLNILPSMSSTNGLEKYLDDLHIPQSNDIDEMDAINKEIADLKKFYIDDAPINPCEQV